jgi:hypothetical protein
MVLVSCSRVALFSAAPFAEAKGVWLVQLKLRKRI